MVNLVGLVIATAVVCIVGGIGGYFIWLKTRPKKEIWHARVYQLSDGIRSPRMAKGEIVGNLKLQDLRPYAMDILEKVEKEKGIVVYYLQKLNKTTPAVESDVVEYWGEGKKEVSVLLDKGGCTLLKKGYDKESGEAIFDPLPHSRINLIKSEMAVRKNRLQKEKDILQAITPWIVAGICMLGLVAIAYVQVDGFIQVSENLEVASENMASIGESKVDLENIKQGSTKSEVITAPTPGVQKDIPSVE